MSEHKYCTQCGKQDIYVSQNGYDTVVVCRDCHHEEHAPYANQKREPFNPKEESYSHYLERIGDQTQESGDC